jgi:menaquinone-specific isochorismate synthase
MTDFALFGTPDGPAWLGVGPFVEEATAPVGASAFYVNDFSLADPRPWKVPTTLVPLTRGAPPAELPADHPIHVRWTKPEVEWFKMAFRRIRKEIVAGRLEKMVPAVTDPGVLMEGDLSALARRVLALNHAAWCYGRVQGDSGFVGATPELLFDLTPEHIQTMALAGTAKPGGDAAFLRDTKEIDEHEIVVRYIVDQLSQWGAVEREPRTIRETAGLRHFQSRLLVPTPKAVEPDELIHRLHPTPAVGSLPHTEEWRAKLLEYRQMLGVPGFFGAPFGYSHEGHVTMVVAIRGVTWKGNRVDLPSGCGIVAGSAFDHEWREIRLKRDSIAKMLGL